MIFEYNKKMSYIYLEKGYFSNIEIMKRIGIILGVELKEDNIFTITKFCLCIKQILAKGDL